MKQKILIILLFVGWFGVLGAQESAVPSSQEIIAAWSNVKTRSLGQDRSSDSNAANIENVSFRVSPEIMKNVVAPILAEKNRQRSLMKSATDRSLGLGLIKLNLTDSHEAPPRVEVEVDKSKEFHFRFQFSLNSTDFADEEEAEDLLDILKVAIRNYPQTLFLVNGHTCDLGEIPDNLKLSQERAARVRTLLIERKVEASRLLPVGWGEAELIDKSFTSAGREKNRRVSVVPVEVEFPK